MSDRATLIAMMVASFAVGLLMCFISAVNDDKVGLAIAMAATLGAAIVTALVAKDLRR